MNTFGIDESWIKGGLDIKLINNIMTVIAKKREKCAILPAQEDILNAIRFHTSGRANMSALEKLIFLADMVEEDRYFDGVDEIRKFFYQGDLDGAMRVALQQSLSFLQKKGAEIYPLTLQAYDCYQ